MKRIVSLLLAIILVVPMGLTNAFALDSKATEHGEIALATVQLSKDTNDDSISPPYSANRIEFWHGLAGFKQAFLPLLC